MNALSLPRSPRLVIVTIEGLGTNLVGCYGGAIAPTKHWDSFASHAFVFDQFWADSLDPKAVLASLWSGTHFASRAQCDFPPDMDGSLAGGIFEKAQFATDSYTALEELDTDHFGDFLFFETEHEDVSPDSDEDIGSTEILQLFEAALGKWSSQLDQFPILWIHSKGLNGRWDAPYEYRQIMCDEGDPDPPTSTEPAEQEITEETDPDEVFGHACAAGGQAIAMDDAWELLNEMIEELGVADDCMLILAGVSGYPLGEHGWVGNNNPALYSETIHLPLIVRPGNRLNLGQRIPFIVQPHHILSTITQWLECGEPSSAPSLVEYEDIPPADQWPADHEVGLSWLDGDVHLIVPAWSCRWCSNSEGQEKVQLFTMPDDRWQQNEVSQRANTIVELMTSTRDCWLAKYQDRASVDEQSLDRLPKELTQPTR